MSGIISEGERDEMEQRFYQRLHDLTQKSNKSIVVAPTSRSRPMIDSTVSGQYINSIQNTNGTLTTDQFYNKSGFQANKTQSEPTQQPLREGSIHSQVSNNSVFKKPFPVKRSMNRHFQRRFDMFVDFFHSIEEKATLKFALTLTETFMHSVKNPPSQPLDPVVLMDYISGLVKDEYYAKRVPKSICGSSLTSDQASSIDQYASNSEKYIRMDVPSRYPLIRDSRIVLQDITRSILHSTQPNRPTEECIGSEYSSIERAGSSFNYQAETSAFREGPAHTRGQNKLEKLPEETLSGSVFNMFNDSEIARRRDEVAAIGGEAHSVLVVSKRGRKPKATPKPIERKINELHVANKKSSNNQSKMPLPDSGNCIEVTSKNLSLLNGTSCGTSRSGRTLKPPVKFWNSKGEELSPGDNDKSILNQSMTLRNKKVLDKAGNKSKSDTPNLAPKSKDLKPEKKPKRRTATPKENVVVEKKKTNKKSADTPIVKQTAPKKKKEEDITKQKTEKTIKKPSSKRKTKESVDVNPKKKKMEEHYESDDDDDDDLFGVPSYKKPQQTLKVALSPSTGLWSAKKAAGEAQGKATPPCKAIGDMMTNESMHLVMSAAKEAPKQNEAIKRVIKKIERNKTNLQAEPKVKTCNKLQSSLSKNMDGKSKFFIDNPTCSAALTIIRGSEQEQESDLSDLEEEDEDDDLM